MAEPTSGQRTPSHHKMVQIEARTTRIRTAYARSARSHEQASHPSHIFFAQAQAQATREWSTPPSIPPARTATNRASSQTDNATIGIRGELARTSPTSKTYSLGREPTFTLTRMQIRIADIPYMAAANLNLRLQIHQGVRSYR